MHSHSYVILPLSQIKSLRFLYGCPILRVQFPFQNIINVTKTHDRTQVLFQILWEFWIFWSFLTCYCHLNMFTKGVCLFSVLPSVAQIYPSRNTLISKSHGLILLFGHLLTCYCRLNKQECAFFLLCMCNTHNTPAIYLPQLLKYEFIIFWIIF